MKPHLLYITSHYPPESGAAARRAGDTVRYLFNCGWRVTVVTAAPNYPGSKVFPGYGQRLLDERDDDGITVLRVRPWIVTRSNLVQRFIAELHFCLLVAVAVWTQRRSYELVYSSSPFMFLGWSGMLIARLQGIPHVWEVRDLTWRYISALGRRSFGLTSVLEALMLSLAKNSNALVTTTLGQRDYFIDRHSCPNRSRVIANGVSEDLLLAINREVKVLSPKEENDNLRVVYAGAIGYPQNLETLIHVAQERPNFSFIIIGDGAERERLERLSSDLRLKNVTFTGYLPTAELLSHYASADILFAQLKDDPAYASAQPTKIWEYMATGRPVLYAGRGEAANAVNESKGGLVVPPEGVSGISKALDMLLLNSNLRTELGSNGKTFVHRHLRREAQLFKLNELLKSLLKST